MLSPRGNVIRLLRHAVRVGYGSNASVERCRHVGFTPDFGRMIATQQTDASGHKATSPFRTTRHQRWATN